MKNLLFIMLIALVGCTGNEQNFVIEGKIDFTNESIAINKINIDLIKIESTDTLRTDENGNFKLEINIKEPTISFARLPDGNPIGIFLEPNKKVEFYHKDGRIVFGESNVLHQLYRDIATTYYQLKKEFSSDVQITSYFDSLLNTQLKKLETLKESGSVALFNYIKYTAIGYNYSKRIRLLIKMDSVPISSDNYNFLDEIAFSDKSVLHSKEYVNMQIKSLPLILKRKGKENSLDSAYQYLSQQITNPAYKKYAQSIFILFNHNSLSKASRLSILKEFEQNYSEKIPVPIEGMLNLLPGNILSDFELESAEGQKVKLSDYKDKMILIDFWATWCSPCLKEEPSVFKIAREYPTDITVFTINFDKATEKWLEHIDKLESLPNAIHFNDKGGLGSAFCKQFYLVGIPRYILLGKRNEIIDAFAPKPSSIQMEELIQLYLE